jgi:Small nuclear RNA activating complex (SNAPc), subunit 1
MNLLGEIRKQDHLDAEFVFLKLRFDKAFQFVATKNEVCGMKKLQIFC